MGISSSLDEIHYYLVCEFRFLYLLSYIALPILICIIAITIAIVLYLITKLVRDLSFREMALKIIYCMAFAVMLLYVIFIFCENFSWTMIACGLLAQGTHVALLNNFDKFALANYRSVLTKGSVAMVLVNHSLAFEYFSEIDYEFLEVLTYFTLCIWLVPFSIVMFMLSYQV